LQAAALEHLPEQRLVAAAVAGLGDGNPNGRRQGAGEPIRHLLAQPEALIAQLRKPRVHLAVGGFQRLALGEQAFQFCPRLGQRQVSLLQLRAFGRPLLVAGAGTDPTLAV
jgi:hypothetical protein